MYMKIKEIADKFGINTVKKETITGKWFIEIFMGEINSVTLKQMKDELSNAGLNVEFWLYRNGSMRMVVIE